MKIEVSKRFIESLRNYIEGKKKFVLLFEIDELFEKCQKMSQNKELIKKMKNFN
jgi:hypothetical protein